MSTFPYTPLRPVRRSDRTRSSCLLFWVAVRDATAHAAGFMSTPIDTGRQGRASQRPRDVQEVIGPRTSWRNTDITPEPTLPSACGYLIE
jgi:hypothetical protein